jgi:hypothetical protein
MIIDFADEKVPCLLVDSIEFENILKVSQGKTNLIDTNLNIFDDGFHVFVNLNIKFMNSSLEYDFLLYANESLDFFRLLSRAGVIGIAPSDSSGANVFFIQLPRKDQAIKAFDLIVSKLPERSKLPEGKKG